MMKKRAILFSILIAGTSFKVISQSPCEVPEPPVLRNVTIDPSTERTVLTWDPSPSDGIAAYIIYTFNEGFGIPVDTIWDPSAVTYSRLSPAVKYFSESYVVAAFRNPICTSPLSNSLSTIFCSASLDTCKNEILLSWNRYSDFPEKVDHYLISVFRDIYTEEDTYTTGSENDNFIYKGFETGTEYCFRITALLDDGSQSSSGISCIETDMQRPPAWIDVEYVTINEGIELSFGIDPDSEIRLFNLERREGYNGSFSVIQNFTNTSLTATYIDRNASINKIWFYRLVAINNCQLPVLYSEVTSNLVVSAEKNDDVILLRWNRYRGWNEGLSSYYININTGNGYRNALEAGRNDTTVLLSYRDFMYEISGSSVCFKVEAKGSSEITGSSLSALSQEECIPVTENIKVADAFTPDGNLVNDKFKPLLSFTPADYRFTIMDIKRNIVFESSDPLEEWDGRYNGTPLPDGVYLWILQLSTPSGTRVRRSGTVTILRNI